MSLKESFFNPSNILQSKGNLLDLSLPKVMGIINITDDSFYAASRALEMSKVLENVNTMIENGADIIDIGATSSRPGAQEYTINEELNRLLPVIERIKIQHPNIWISIDTYNAQVAQQSILAGADMVNDISGGLFDLNMYDTIAALNVPYIAMHLRGTFQTMHQAQQYNNVGLEVMQELQQLIYKAHQAGIKDIIIDPGFGFSKSTSENFELLQNMSVLKVLQKPILVGISRKSMIYKTLQITPEEALAATSALHMAALYQGAKLLRVHDVKEARQCITLYNKLNKSSH